LPSTLKPSLIFVGKARALFSGAPFSAYFKRVMLTNKVLG